jgi:hypothetical protein
MLRHGTPGQQLCLGYEAELIHFFIYLLHRGLSIGRWRHGKVFTR